MSDTKQAIEKLIADLDKGRMDGSIYTYGQVQERLREILSAQVVPQPNRDVVIDAVCPEGQMHTYAAGHDECERIADAVIAHLSAQPVGGEVPELFPGTRAALDHLSIRTERVLTADEEAARATTGFPPRPLRKDSFA